MIYNIFEFTYDWLIIDTVKSVTINNVKQLKSFLFVKAKGMCIFDIVIE